MKNISFFLKQHIALCSLTMLALIGQIMGTLAVPYLIGKLIDVGIVSGERDLIFKIGLQMLAVAIGGSLAAILGSYLTGRVAAVYGYEVRQQFYHKVQQLPLAEAEEFGVSSLLNRLTSDVTNVQRSLALFIQMILPAPIICIFAVVMAFKNSSTLALVLLFAIAIYLVVVTILLKKGLPLSTTIQIRLDKLVVKLREFFNGIKIIRAFDQQNQQEAKTNDLFKDYSQGMIQVNRIFAFLTPAAYLIMGTVFALIVWFGGLLVGAGDLQIGVVTAVVEYSMQALFYLIMAAMVIVTLPRSLASLARIEEILVTEVPNYDLGVAGQPDFNKTETLVEFKDVAFAYGEAEPVLEQINFILKRGETLAIVGGTGSGKSTLAKLLLNLTPPTKGEIIFRGRPTSQLSSNDLRARISYVPQKAFLFSGTIESNLRFGRPNATDKELAWASRIAQASEFIQQQDLGYQGIVAQGGDNFSGGQKQRLSIARAIVKEADLYVFDDSFSALDYQTEQKLRQSLGKEMPEATFLIVAQRLSTIKEADQIIVLEQGKIVGQGRHQDLLKNNQTYQEFALSQGLALEGEQ